MQFKLVGENFCHLKTVNLGKKMVGNQKFSQTLGSGGPCLYVFSHPTRLKYREIKMEKQKIKIFSKMAEDTHF